MWSRSDVLEDGQQSLETSGKGWAQGSSDVSGGLVHECVHRFVCDWKVTEMLRGGASAEEVGDGDMSAVMEAVLYYRPTAVTQLVMG